MKKIVGSFIAFCGLFFLVSNVYAVECKYEALECVSEKGYHYKANPDYTIAGDCEFLVEQERDWITLDSYNSGTSHNYTGGDETLENWDDKDYCPNVIRVTHAAWYDIFDDKEWYGYKDLDSARSDLKDYDEIFVYDKYLEELRSGADDFDNKVDYTCSYDYFDIEYNKEGYALRVVEKNPNANLGVVSFYSLSDNMRTLPATEPGVCENVYRCMTVNNGTTVTSYMIFTDSADFDQDGKSCQSFNGSDGSVSSDSGDNPTCRSLSSKFSEYETSYKDCIGNGTKCELASEIELKMQTTCQNIYKKQIYGDECLVDCLDLDRKIAVVKQTSAKDYNQSQCGFSARLINWIMKIIKWIRYIVPILLIVLSVMDFIKAVSSDSEDEMRKVGAKFVKRLIVAALIFVLPLLLEFLLGIFNIPVKDFCV